MTTISNEGIALIKQFEGLELESYQDVAGIWTIGYGHTGPEVGPGQVISESEAEELLRMDVERFERGVDRLVRVPITQSMFDALVSFSFNVGVSAFEGSTARRRLNNQEYEGAAEALTWWNKARVNGELQVIPGLSRRRAAEAALFLRDVEELSPALESTAGLAVEETPQRRSNPVNTRTVGGATTAGTAGAGAAATVVLDDDDDGEVEADEVPGAQPTDDATNDNDAGDPEDIEDDALADQTGDDLEAELDGGLDAATSDEPAEGESDADEELEPVTEVPAEPAPEADGGGRDDHVDAIVIALGILAVLAALYIVWARIDDWRNFRR